MSARTTHRESLRSIPMFANMSDESLERVGALLNEVEFPAGHVLVQPNTAGSGLFILEEGQVTIEVHGRTLTRGPGEFFGELSLLTDRDRTARVRALTGVKCLAMSRSDFRTALEQEPTLAINMLEILAERLAANATD